MLTFKQEEGYRSPTKAEGVIGRWLEKLHPELGWQRAALVIQKGDVVQRLALARAGIQDVDARSIEHVTLAQLGVAPAARLQRRLTAVFEIPPAVDVLEYFQSPERFPDVGRGESVL